MENNILNSNIIKGKFKLDARHSKTMSGLLNAMLECQTGNLATISRYVKDSIKQESVYRKLQRFMGKVDIDEDTCACSILEILDISEGEQLILAMDRTYWMHGKNHLNFLYLSVYYRGYGIPVYFKVLPGLKGHSGVSARKELLEKFIRQFGKERIAYIAADREFDGSEWLNYLKTEGISFVQRLKENSVSMTNGRGQFERAASLCHHLAPGQVEGFGIRKIYKKAPFTTRVTVAKSPKGNILLLAHSSDIKDPTLAYRARWAIECGFRAMKSGGFNMDKTSMVATRKLYQFYRIIALLTAITHKLGVLIDKVNPIKLKSHGRKAISYVRLALQHIFRTNRSHAKPKPPKRLPQTFDIAYLFNLCRVR